MNNTHTDSRQKRAKARTLGAEVHQGAPGAYFFNFRRAPAPLPLGRPRLH